MRGLLVGAVGILVLVAGLVIAVKHMFALQPARREAVITGAQAPCSAAATGDAGRSVANCPR